MRRARMRKCRICSIWRMLSYLGRPYVVFGIGIVCLMVSIGVLTTRTDNHWRRQAFLIENIAMMREFTAEYDPKNFSHTTPGDVHPTWTFPRSSALLALKATSTRLEQFKAKVKPGSFAVRKPAQDVGATYFRFSDQVESQAERALRIQSVCRWQKQHANHGGTSGTVPYYTGWYGKPFVYSVLEVYEEQNLLFCPVLKVGSTFWRRLWYALRHGRQIVSPYDISINRALNDKRKRLRDLAEGAVGSPQRRPGPWPNLTLHPQQSRKESSWDESAVQEFLQKAGSIMFTREPYGKLLSGYVDKLFAPNPFFWSAIGKHIIKSFRPNASQKSLVCGHDVTFPEFIKYVLESERTGEFKRDAHFAPTFDQCQPCNFSYDVVGKMESFPQDASLVLSLLGYNLSQSTIAEWSRLSEFDAIQDSIVSPYSWRKPITKCMSWEEANRRIWRKMQIRGIVDRDEDLPVSNFRQYTSSHRYFTEVVKGAWQVFRQTGRKSSQKKAAMSSAYSLVPKEDLRKLREYFLIDFDVFGYDSRPDIVFSAQNTWDVFDVSS